MLSFVVLCYTVLCFNAAWLNKHYVTGWGEKTANSAPFSLFSSLFFLLNCVLCRHTPDSLRFNDWYISHAQEWLFKINWCLGRNVTFTKSLSLRRKEGNKSFHIGPLAQFLVWQSCNFLHCYFFCLCYCYYFLHWYYFWLCHHYNFLHRYYFGA